MKWTDLLRHEMEATYSATEKMLEMLKDSDLDWKPATGDNWMTVGQLLLHINASCGICCQCFATGDWNMPGDNCDENSGEEPKMPKAEQLVAVTSLKEARNALAEDRKLAFQMLEKAGEENLENAMSAAPWAPQQQLSLGHHMLHMVDHLNSHKSQLFYYLKLMGRPVDTMTLWGM